MGLNITMIRHSFDQAKPLAERIADRFYENLWTDYPLSKVLFGGVDMEKQKKALMGAFIQIVEMLDQSPRLVEYLQAMGARHLYYGAEDLHFEWIGSTLLKTFGEFLGDSWTPPIVEQWTLAYQFIADHMKAGVESARAKEAEGAKNTTPKPVLLKVVEEEKKMDEQHQEKLTIDLPAGFQQKIRDAVQQAVDQYVEQEIRAALQSFEKKLDSQGIMSVLTRKSS